MNLNNLSSYIMYLFGFKLLWRLRFCSAVFSFFFFFFFLVKSAFVDFSTDALFTDPQITFFSNFFIKNESHGTIHTFKNYFTTVFSVSVFSFSKNKLNPNEPYIYTKMNYQWVKTLSLFFIIALDAYIYIYIK